jgi:hypothetical protein
MSANTPEPMDKDLVIYGLTTAVGSLKEKLEAAAIKNQTTIRQLAEATEAREGLERQLAAKDKELAKALVAKDESIQRAAAREQEIQFLEGFLEELGMDLPTLKHKASGPWAPAAARLMKIVYDPARETPGVTDVLRHTAQILSVDHRPPQAG